MPPSARSPPQGAAALYSPPYVRPGLLEDATKRLPEILDRIRELAASESPTDDPAAVNAAGALVEKWGTALGASVVRHAPALDSVTPAGDVWELRFGTHDNPTAARPILLLGHLDTVWPKGTLAAMPVRDDAGKLFGPGVLDMKAGIVMALTALALRQDQKRHVTLLLAADEETGSATSRPVTERLALASSCALVLEPAQGLACKTARKGVGHFELRVTGIAAHAGVDFTAGHSAIRELAHQIEHIAALTDLSRGITINPGVIRGGTRSNVVAAEASVEIDVRIAQTTDAARIEERLRALTPRDPACTLTLTGGINRPPMERTPAGAELYTHARACAAALGFTLDEAATGGGSDGNFTAALGVPTLDGLGAIGAGAHATHEHIVVEHLAPRTALLAALLDTL